MTMSETTKSTRERLAERKKQEKPAEKHLSFGQRTRGLLDALVFAFVLAMFIRSFVFELFMIPTGSMTPTLIGDLAGEVAFIDYDKDGIEDVVSAQRVSNGSYTDVLHVYLMNEDGSYRDQVFIDGVSPTDVHNVVRSSHQRKDMIIVNKFAYWFSPPERGDIAVFKVPHKPPNIEFETDKPVYIKRAVGLPGETVTFLPVQHEIIPLGGDGRTGTVFGGTEVHITASPLHINGEPVQNGVFSHLMHYPKFQSLYPRPDDPLQNIEVSENGVLMIGDNAASSKDGRYFNEVPLNHLRGQAVLRYFPLKAFGFLK